MVVWVDVFEQVAHHPVSFLLMEPVRHRFHHPVVIESILCTLNPGSLIVNLDDYLRAMIVNLVGLFGMLIFFILNPNKIVESNGNITWKCILLKL